MTIHSFFIIGSEPRIFDLSQSDTEIFLGISGQTHTAAPAQPDPAVFRVRGERSGHFWRFRHGSLPGVPSVHPEHLLYHKMGFSAVFSLFLAAWSSARGLCIRSTLFPDSHQGTGRLFPSTANRIEPGYLAVFSGIPGIPVQNRPLCSSKQQ